MKSMKFTKTATFLFPLLNIPKVPMQYVLRIPDNTVIPFDPGNVDYQAYLAWLAEGNTPLPPDA